MEGGFWPNPTDKLDERPRSGWFGNEGLFKLIGDGGLNVSESSSRLTSRAAAAFSIRSSSCGSTKFPPPLARSDSDPTGPVGRYESCCVTMLMCNLTSIWSALPVLRRTVMSRNARTEVPDIMNLPKPYMLRSMIILILVIHGVRQICQLRVLLRYLCIPSVTVAPLRPRICWSSCTEGCWGCVRRRVSHVLRRHWIVEATPRWSAGNRVGRSQSLFDGGRERGSRLVTVVERWRASDTSIAVLHGECCETSPTSCSQIDRTRRGVHAKVVDGPGDFVRLWLWIEWSGLVWGWLI